MRPFRFSVRLALLTTCVSLSAIGVAVFPAAAQAQTASGQTAALRDFDIPAQPLPAAIMAFTEQSGIQIAYSSALGAGRQSRRVQGRVRPLDALATLLVGTGLTYRRTGADSVVLEPQPIASAAGSSEPDGPRLGSVTVSATAIDNGPTTENNRSLTSDRVTVDRLATSLREIPQAVTVITRQQLDALNLNKVNDALAIQAGTIVIQNDRTNERAEVLFRGSLVDSLRVDGGAISGNNDVNLFDAAIYDRIELLRGPAGILQGTGSPGGTINMVRRRAPSEIALGVEAQVGSWDQYRGVIDIGAPLTASGAVRARAIGVYDDSDSFDDLTYSKRRTLFGTLDFDVTPDTTLTLGGTWQRVTGRNDRGLPGYDNGIVPTLPRSTFIGADWNHNVTRSIDVFANLEHRLAGDAVFRVIASYLDRSRHGKLAFPDSPIDQATGNVELLPEYRIDREENVNIDANLRLPFVMGGLEQVLLVGADYRRINEGREEAATDTVEQNVFAPDHAIPEPDWDFNAFQSSRSEQFGLYAQLRAKPVSWGTIVAGGRLTWWDGQSFDGDDLDSSAEVRAKFTPYVAALADLSDHLTVYASYTAIFVPQDDVTVANQQVDPREGRQLELGIKGSWLDGRLNGHAAIFDLRDRNRAIADIRNPDFAIAAGRVRSRGFETEISGEVLPGLQIIAGYSHIDAIYLEDEEFTGLRFEPRVPKHSGRIWANYSVANGSLAGLSFGGGVRAYSPTYERDGDVNYHNGSYAVADIQAGYRINDRIEVTGTITNLFDRTYYAVMGYSERQTYYGAPRAYAVKLRTRL